MSATTSVEFTVGKLDAGMAILLTEDHHLIEFPSLLLPPGVTSGSIVNIAVNRNREQEEARLTEFWKLQERILAEYGKHPPESPKLKVKHITQTSVLLEWEPLKLYKAKFKSLDIYKNGDRLSQHVPVGINFIKLSGLELNTDYEFYINMKTTAGSYTSNKLTVKTHKLDNLTGINVCFGAFSESDDGTPKVDELKEVIKRISATWSEHVGPETTHLLCNVQGGVEYQRALDGSIPIVKPEWLVASEKKGTLQAALPYYLVPQGDNTNSS
ncbi:7081_t:CDS:2 [Paraglomus brasilianum]|uniref:7081_t:CDS:1 n=1 Tax=Paraglomus brasilianum TaxID=144538 RepID=A0A9N9B9Q0_9GLOM|nr:7081_t:CDS:2 [Paraglomus brasilianum]